MHWLIFAGIGVIAGSFSNLYQKMTLSRDKSDPVVFAIAFQVITATLYGIFAISRGFHLPDASLIPYFIASSALYAAGTLYFFRAIQRIEASEMSILGSVGTLITIIISIIFLGDSFTTIQFVGALCVFAAVIIINLKKGGLKINDGVWWALAGAACFGIAVTFDSHIVRNFEAVSFIPLSALGTAIMLSVWYYKKIPATIKVFQKFDKNLWIFCTLYATSSVSFYTGLQQGALVGQMSTIFRAMIILTVLLSTVFLKERKYLGRKIIAAGMTTLGVILVS